MPIPVPSSPEELAMSKGQYTPPPMAGLSPFEDPSFLSKIRDIYKTSPYAEAERAVESAITFQGIRGYQRDIENGMDQDSAMTRWAPSIFYRQPSALAGIMEQQQRRRAIAAERQRIAATPAPTGYSRDMATGQVYKLPVPPPEMPKVIELPGIPGIKAIIQNGKVVGAPIQPKQEKSTVNQDVSALRTEANIIFGRLREIAARGEKDPLEDTLRRRLTGIQLEIQQLTGKPKDQAKPAETPQPVKSGGRIKVKSPDGKLGTIPEYQLEEALKAGYTRAD